MSRTAYERLIEALSEAGSTVNASSNGQGDYAMAQCPAHDDHNPSLRITDAPGSALMHCFAGCDTRDVLGALDLTAADLFDSSGGVKYLYPDNRVVHRTPDKKFKQSGNMRAKSLYHLTWLKLVRTVGADLDERVAEVVG
jgi:DNA primase